MPSGSESTANGRTEDGGESPDSAEKSTIFASFAEGNEVCYDDFGKRDDATTTKALHSYYQTGTSLIYCSQRK